MAAPHGVWGIDIGQCALKALRLELIDGEPTVSAFDYIEHPKILSQPDADPDQLTREALETFLSRNSLKGDKVAISVPGQSGLARFVKLPPVEPKKIPDIVKFEAKQQIPFPLDEVVWDYQKIGTGEMAGDFALETEVGLFAMKRDQIARQLQHYTDVGIEVDIVQMAPLALCNFITFELLGIGGPPVPPDPAEDDTPAGKRKCVVALDVGADSSNLVVSDGGRIIWQRPIPLGGNHMTRALSKELKLTFAKAEHLKKNAAKSPPELKTILTALKPVLTDLVGETQRSLGYFTNTHRDAHIAYLVALGSAFRLPGLQKYLQEKLQLDVRKPVTFQRLKGEDELNKPLLNENMLSFAVAYGLAVQGLNLGRLTTSLLPEEIRTERMIRAKKPWAVAAAAAIFAGVGVLTAGHAFRYGAVNAAIIQESMQQADRVLQQVNTQKSTADQKKQEREQAIRDVSSIIAGKDEQLNWLKLNQYVNACLPRPGNDGNLLRDGTKPKPGGAPGEREPNQQIYWRTREAIEAFRLFVDRVAGSQSADLPLDDEVREQLPLVDIEAIDTIYCGNLKAFYDAAKAETARLGKEFDGMLKFDVDNPPKEGDEGKGWVIALRGSTFQKKGRDFVVDTLVYNLAANVRRNFATAEAAPTPPPDAGPVATQAPVDPLTDRVSHVFLYHCWIVDNPQPGAFQNINANILPKLVAPAADPSAAGGAAAPTADFGGGGPTARPAAWAPLGSGGTVTPGGGSGFSGAGFSGGSVSSSAINPYGPVPVGVSAGPPGGMPRGGRDDGPAFGPGPTGGPPGGFGGGPPGTAPAAVKKAKPRHEFIVMFIWREPTPSDALIASPNP